MDKIKLVAILGKSGSGKDTILKSLPEDWNRVIAHTSRPKRDYETNGQDAYFASYREIEKDKNILGKQIFNNWYYGFHRDSFKKDKINVGVFNLASLELLQKENIFDIMIFHIYAKGVTRLQRSLNREYAPDEKEIIRRYLADENDFKNIDNIFPNALWLENEQPADLVSCLRIIEEQGKLFEKENG